MVLISTEQAWYVLISIFLVGWILLYKHDHKPNFKNDLKIGFAALLIFVSMAVFGVSNSLWIFYANKFPWQLLPVSFILGMLFYQLTNYFARR